MKDMLIQLCSADGVTGFEGHAAQKAAELLAGTALKISDIGAQCGFQETSYFIKTFRELMGRTPAAYRAQKRASPK